MSDGEYRYYLDRVGYVTRQDGNKGPYAMLHKATCGHIGDKATKPEENEWRPPLVDQPFPTPEAAREDFDNIATHPDDCPLFVCKHCRPPSW